MNEKLIARTQSPGPKKILALDGGGIRGMMTVEVLAEIENLLRQKLGRGTDFVLADYFDLVAHVKDLQRVGRAVANKVTAEHFADF